MQLDHLIFLACLLLHPFPLHAASADSSAELKVSVTGAYHAGWSDTLHYEGASPGGEFNNLELAVPLELTLGESWRLEVVGTLNTRHPYELRYSGRDVPRASLQWHWNASTSLHTGRSATPLGLQNEGRYRPFKRHFSGLPTGFYGFNNLVGSDYTGLGVHHGWENESIKAGLDIYGGQARIPTTRYSESAGDYYAIRNGPYSAGGRLLVELLNANLTLALSGTVGVRSNEDKPIDYLVAGSLLYQNPSLEVLFEGLYGRSIDDATDFYLQATYFLIEQLSVLARFDWLDVFPREAPGRFLRHHQEIVLALCYRISDQWRAELSYHLLTGNRFARPDGSETTSIESENAKDWELHGQSGMLGLVFEY